MQDESTLGPGSALRMQRSVRSATGIRLHASGAVALLLMPAAMACTSMVAMAEPPRSFVRLLDRDGSWSAGRVVSLDGTHWTLESRADPARPDSVSTVRIDRSRIVAGIVQRWSIEPYPASHFDPWGPVPPYAEPLSTAMLELVDGQRLPGSYQVGPNGAAWDHRWIGALPLATDRIASIRFLPATAIRRLADSDLVILSNGDRVVGFIESLGADIVLDSNGSDAAARSDAAVDASSDDNRAEKPAQSDPPGAQGMRKFPVDRIAAIAFAAIEAVEAPRLLVWTMDGSVVGAKELAFDDITGWSFSLTDATLASVRQRSTADNMAADPVGFVSETRSFIPLASLGFPRVARPEGTIHYGLDSACRVAPADQVSLGLASVELTGPVVAEFGDAKTAADGPARPFVFSAMVRLVEPAPLDAAVDVIVDLGGDATRRIRLDLRNPVERLTLVGAPAAAPRVRITLDDAGNGPIGDRVVFERAVFVQGPSD